MSISNSRRKLLLAYSKGYRVFNGKVVSPKGKTLSVYIPKSGRPYPRFSIYFEGRPASVDVHRLASYQKFGDAMFETGVEVRHLNVNPQDFSFDNLALGSPTENALDIPDGLRSSRSSVGGKIGGRKNRVFAKDQIFSILDDLASMSQKEVAEKYQVSTRVINNISRGQSYNEFYREYHQRP